LGEALERKVPAWSWSWFLFDRLISAFCFVYKVTPLSVDLLEQEGRVFMVDNLNGMTERRDPDVALRSILCSILLPDEPFFEHTASREQLFSCRKQLLDADHFVGTTHFLECDGMPREPIPWINPGWWRMHENHLTLEDTKFC
jgi:hypothetical protein